VCEVSLTCRVQYALCNSVIRLWSVDDDLYTPEKHLPTPGQRGHTPQRYTAAGIAAPATTDTGNIVPQVSYPSNLPKWFHRFYPGGNFRAELPPPSEY